MTCKVLVNCDAELEDLESLASFDVNMLDLSELTRLGYEKDTQMSGRGTFTTPNRVVADQLMDFINSATIYDVELAADDGEDK